MVGDPRDKWAYRIALGALGLALLVALSGAVLIVALKIKVHPIGLYVVGAMLAGGLLGVLIPLPWPARVASGVSGDSGSGDSARTLIVAAILILLGIFAATVSVGIVESDVALQTIGAASGGVLLGLFVPSPAIR